MVGINPPMRPMMNNINTNFGVKPNLFYKHPPVINFFLKGYFPFVRNPDGTAINTEPTDHFHYQNMQNQNMNNADPKQQAVIYLLEALSNLLLNAGNITSDQPNYMTNNPFPGTGDLLSDLNQVRIQGPDFNVLLRRRNGYEIPKDKNTKSHKATNDFDSEIKPNWIIEPLSKSHAQILANKNPINPIHNTRNTKNMNEDMFSMYRPNNWIPINAVKRYDNNIYNQSNTKQLNHWNMSNFDLSSDESKSKVFANTENTLTSENNYTRSAEENKKY